MEMKIPMLGLVLASVLASTSATDSAAEREGIQHLERMVASLRASPSPRDRALATRIYTIDMLTHPQTQAWRGVALRKAAADAPNDRLVQWLWAIADDAGSGCDAAHPCPERTMALARLEPDNAAAWMPTGQDAWKRRDHAALDSMLQHMAAASHHDELFEEATVALSDIYARYPIPMTVTKAWTASEKRESGTTPDIDPETAGKISAIGQAALIALPAMAAMQACDREKNSDAAESRFENCGRLGRMMLADGRTMWSIRIATIVLMRSGEMDGDDIALIRGQRWRSEQANMLFATFPSYMAGFRDYFADLESTRNELRAQELQLQRAGIPLTPPDGWMPKDLADLKPGR
jgi:hypothetical protein